MTSLETLEPLNDLTVCLDMSLGKSQKVVTQNLGLKPLMTSLQVQKTLPHGYKIIGNFVLTLKFVQFYYML